MIDHFKTLPRDKELFKEILAKYACIAKLSENEIEQTQKPRKRARSTSQESKPNADIQAHPVTTRNRSKSPVPITKPNINTQSRSKPQVRMPDRNIITRNKSTSPVQRTRRSKSAPVFEQDINGNVHDQIAQVIEQDINGNMDKEIAPVIEQDEKG